MSNIVLNAISERRTIYRFKSTPIDNEQLNLVLEAGRWAPSWANAQPWRFIVINDKETKEKIGDSVTTIFSLGMKEAPICIAVCVNPKKDAFHYIEDGAAVTQNMALAAHSMGLGTMWVGIFSLRDEKKSTERKIKKILNIPDQWRIISLLPLGIPQNKVAKSKSRKDLPSLVDMNSFQIRDM